MSLSDQTLVKAIKVLYVGSFKESHSIAAVNIYQYMSKLVILVRVMLLIR